MHGKATKYERQGEAGFTLLGVLVAVMIIGIMATIAVPRFNSIIASANTAKVQADLTTLDTAIVIYQTEKGTLPSNISDLKDYVTDLDNLKPPQGTCNLKNDKTVDITATAYELKDVADGSSSTLTTRRATCAGLTAGDFGK